MADDNLGLQKVLLDAADILAKPGAFHASLSEAAIDADGNTVAWAADPRAVSFSPMGAITAAGKGFFDISAYDHLRSHIGLPEPVCRSREKGGQYTTNLNEWALDKSQTQVVEAFIAAANAI